jgi:hypothetical protein
MRKNEIKPGIVYAYQRSRDHGSPEPIVFLTAPASGQLYTTASMYKKPGEPAYVRVYEGSKPRSASTWTGPQTGYAAVRLSWNSRVDPQDLLKVTLAEFEKTTSSHATGIEGTYFTVATNLTGIVGLYDEATASYEAKRAAEHEQMKRESAERDSLRTRANRICDELAARGVSGYFNGFQPGNGITLSLSDAETLLALLESNVAGS